MRIRLSGIATTLVVCLLAGVVTGEDNASATDPMFDFLQAKANQLAKVGGLAAIGIATDSQAFAIEEAERNARMAIVMIVRTKMQSQKDIVFKMAEIPENTAMADMFEKYFLVAESLVVHAALFSISADKDYTMTRGRGDQTTAGRAITFDSPLTG